MADGWRKQPQDCADQDELSNYQIDVLLQNEIRIIGKDVNLSLAEERRLDRVSHTTVTASGKSHGSLSPHDEHYDVEIRFRYGTCDTCGMLSGGYYEAILQVRADGRGLTDDEKDAIMKTVTDITVAKYRSDDKAFITSTTDDKFGTDFYIGSENLCKYLASELEIQYLAERKENYKLYGEDKTGRRKYRITILIRLPRFTVGDFVRVDNIPCQIVALGRNMLTCYDLKRRERFSINQKSARWRTLEFLAPLSSRREFMVTTKSYGQPTQIMDSATFEVLEVDEEALESGTVAGAKIYALSVEDGFYILPDQNQLTE